MTVSGVRGTAIHEHHITLRGTLAPRCNTRPLLTITSDRHFALSPGNVGELLSANGAF
jgi:hypothetical protein